MQLRNSLIDFMTSAAMVLQKEYSRLLLKRKEVPGNARIVTILLIPIIYARIKIMAAGIGVKTYENTLNIHQFTPR